MGISENVPPYLRRQPPHQRVRYETELDPGAAERNVRNQTFRDEAPEYVVNLMSTDVQKDSSHLCAQLEWHKQTCRGMVRTVLSEAGRITMGGLHEELANAVSMPREATAFG